MKPVLDACCGPRMFWFDKDDPRAVFVDIRRETHELNFGYAERRTVVVNPNIIADFRDLPFESETFSCVVFDPPHLRRNGAKGFITKKYGVLGDDWREMIGKGFAECFRVLKPHGTLVFKCSEGDISINEILKLTPERPLFGNRYGKHLKSHWIVFIKV